jgi:hypothetical protein
VNFSIIKKTQVLAFASFLLIPVVMVLGGMLVIFIDPEIALRTANYERNYQLLNSLKTVLLLATAAVDLGLWVLGCFLMLKSKSQSYWWLILAALGPFGLAGIAMLDDKDPLPGDLYQRFVQGMRTIPRVAYELGVFVVVWVAAFLGMVIMRDIGIMMQSASSGMTTAQIIDLQNASSGMYAFTEGLEAMGLLVLFYLVFPILINLAGALSPSRRRTLPPLSHRAQ